MSRYIDADALECDTEWSEYHDGFISYSQLEIDTAPSIDIVFCKDCKLGGTEDCPMDEIDDEYFCNFGEREGE